MKYIPNTTTNYKPPSNAVIPRRIDPIHHYSLIQKLGFPTGVKCWCGAQLSFQVHERGMQTKRKAFFDQHDGCEAKEIQS